MRQKGATLHEGSIDRCTSAAMGGSVLHLEVGLSAGWNKREREREREREVCVSRSVICLSRGCVWQWTLSKSDDGSWSCEVHYASTITHVYHAILACYCPAKRISRQEFLFATKGLWSCHQEWRWRRKCPDSTVYG
jgi:hypothetical protein